MASQSQFLDVITRDEAVRRFQQHLTLAPLGRERLPLAATLDRVLAEDVVADIDVPGFDRSNVDGYAVLAADTFGAMEEREHALQLNAESLAPGVVPRQVVEPGSATAIATGGMLPRGADAVVMVEHTDVASDASRAAVRVRHTRWETPACTVVLTEHGAHVVTDEPVRAPAPGQAAALYDGERLLGGGYIV